MSGIEDISLSPPPSSAEEDFVSLSTGLASAADLEKRAQVEAALAAWADLRRRFPHDKRPYLAAAKALLARARFADADALLKEAVARFPENGAMAVEYGRVPFAARDWPEAARRFTEITRRFPFQVPAYNMLVNACVAMKDAAQAEAAVASALARLPDDPAILALQARFAHGANRFSEAITLWESFRTRFPAQADGYVGGAQALRASGRLDDAERLLEQNAARFKDHGGVLMQHALTATSRHAWQLAFDRWDDLLSRFPISHGIERGVGDLITLWRHACDEREAEALAVSVPERLRARAGFEPEKHVGSPADLSDRDLMMAFEGLGDRCEFGLVQRHFGAEPLSLLRWSVVSPVCLANMIASAFDGVGEPENTFIKVTLGEYFTGDTRYFTMHTFVRDKAIPEDRMLATSITRMKFLKNKLVQDLAAGDKIFVYKRHGHKMTINEEERLTSSLRKHFPKSSILIVYLAPQPNLAGTVEIRGPGHYVGYLDKIDLGPAHISYAVWNKLCRIVHADWLTHRAAAAQN